VARGEGPWTDLRLVWETPEVAVAVPEAGGLRLRGLSVGGRLARVRLSGADLPETLVLRLDAQRVTLARVAPEAGDEAAGIGRYAGRLNKPPAEVVHALDGRASDCPTWDLRVGAADGLRPVGLPAELLPVPGEIVAAPPVLAAGAFSGWAVSGVHGAEFAQIVLVEPEPPPPADAPPPAGGEEAAPPLPVIHATVAARTTSPEAQAACGEAFAAAGYRLALPASVLDGRPRRLVLEARAGAASLVLWSGDFAADEGVLTAQLRQCDTREALQDLLLRAAAAGQHRLIDAYFAAPRSISPHVLEAAEAFEILSAAILSDVGSRRPERMNRLYAGLWTHAQTSSQQQLDVLARALHVVLKAETGGSPARFPHGPLAELAVDLIVTMPRTKVSPDALAQFARAALAVRRLPLARQIVRDGLAEHPDAPALLVADAQVELALGAPARAEAMARKALEKKARHPEALLVLARALAVQGRPIEAAATISGGGGLSAWLDRPPSYEAAKLVAALDWPGVIRAVAQASDRQGLLDDLARADAVLGAPVAPEAGGYTLAFLDPGKSPPDLAPLFAALAPGGCTQVALVPGQTMSEIECIGAHALVFRTARAVSPDLVQALFAQTRPADQIVRLVECKLGKTGAPESPESITTVGALVGVAALRAFGEVDFPTFMARAEGALRIKTVLI
jgi:tetratricopeptide (TPR) repeat protein